MNTLTITALYASLLALLFIWLSMQTIKVRQKTKVALGDGGDQKLLRMMRCHANFSEYVPITIILMGLAETNGAYSIILHAAGLSLLIGRILHAYGVSQLDENINIRVSGMIITFSVIATLALTNIATVISHSF
ncbi:MAG: MAPEG family protein [Pseudomonadota bacterium]